MEKTQEIALTEMKKSVHKLGPSTEKFGDPTLTTFLIARSMDPDKAEKMFVQRHKWRASFVPNGFVSDAEVKDEFKSACTATTAEAVEVLKCLTCPRQITNTDATPVLLDGSNNQVNIDNELKWKDLFLLLSDVGIEDSYISYLKPVYEGIRRYPSTSYRIVWVPVVKQWNQDKENQFEMSRLKMPWYTLKCFSTKPDMKYMKKKWKYKGKPAVVVMTSAGMVKNKNAFPLIKERGMAAFPFFE